MALGDSYATIAELKVRLGGVTGSTDDAALTSALAVASRGIEKICGRQFNVAAAATARIFYPCSQWLVEVDDISTTSGLLVATDESDAATYATSWASTDYQLEPLNGIVDAESGWPYYRIRAVAGRVFPTSTLRAPIQVTAKWGWTAVPAGVKEACLVVSEETFKLKDAPYGVIGVAEWGGVRVRANPMAMAMIAPYTLRPVLVA